MSEEVECQECHDYSGTVKGLCSHVGKGHDIDWDTYRDRYDIDDSEMSEQNRYNAKKGYRLKRKHDGYDN